MAQKIFRINRTTLDKIDERVEPKIESFILIGDVYKDNITDKNSYSASKEKYFIRPNGTFELNCTANTKPDKTGQRCDRNNASLASPVPAGELLPQETMEANCMLYREQSNITIQISQHEKLVMRLILPVLILDW